MWSSRINRLKTIFGSFRNVSSSTLKKTTKLPPPPQGPLTKYVEKFATPGARRRFMFGALNLSMIVYGYKMSIHSWGQEYVKMFYQHYSTPDKPTKISKRIGDLITRVIEELSLTDEEISRIKIFVSGAPEIFSWGNLYSKAGALIGYPNFFHFDLKDNPPPTDVSFGRSRTMEKLPPSKTRSREFVNFRESVVLSDEALKFAFAREFLKCRNRNWKADAAFPAFMIGLTYGTCKIINVKFLSLHKGFFGFRFLQYIAVSTLYLMTYIRIRDNRAYKMDIFLDESVRDLAPEYKRGGIEYYDKTLKRNLALRELIPNKKGESLYNLKGDYHPGLFTYSLPISKRKEILSQN